jgi:hypothetical protein
VILSNGDGTFAATDWPRSRQVGSCTLAQREAQTGRHFEGWASSMGGYTLTSTTTAGSGGTPIGDDMPLDATDKQFLNELGAAIVQQISGSAPAIYGTGGPTIEQVRADLGYLRDTTFKSIQESVSALTVDSKGTADIAPLLAAINALPAQTATAVKAALKAAL